MKRKVKGKGEKGKSNRENVEGQDRQGEEWSDCESILSTNDSVGGK